MPVEPRPLGTLIKQEPLPPAFWPEHAQASYRLFYQGLAYNGARKLVTGSAFIPEGSPPTDGWPVVAFAHGTTGLSDKSAPSRSGLSKPERKHVDGWLDAGYAVTATDYEGLATPGPHPYFNGEAVADDVVDAVRAAHGLGHLLSPKWIVAGFSQGGHAAFFTAIIATAYAPELDFRGAVTFGPAVSLREAIRIGTTDGSGAVSWLVPVFLAGLAVSNSDFHPERFVTEAGQRLLDRAQTGDLRDMIKATSTVTNDEAGTTGLADHPEIVRLLAQIDAPVTSLDRPALITAGEGDEIIPFSIMGPYTTSLQEAGTEIKLSGCIANHVGVLSAGLPEAIVWANEVMQRPPTVAEARTGQSRFALLDANGDGYLRRDDYQAFALRLVQSLGQAPRSPKAAAVRDGYMLLWRAISAADTDGDGQVSETEYLQWIDQAARSDGFALAIEPLARSVVALVDDDASGVLDHAELSRLLLACKLTQLETDDVIARLDTDKSGKVTVDEIVAAVHQFCLGGDTAGHWLFGSF